jgi:hypothetical protein
MRLKRCRSSNAGTNRRKYGDRSHASRASGSITILGAHCDAVARQTHEAESLSALLCHNDPLATTDEIGIQEARASDQARVTDCGRTNTFEQRTVALWDLWIVRGSPAACPLSCCAEWDRRGWNGTAINPPRGSMQVNAQQFTNYGAQLALHGVVEVVVPDRIESASLGHKQERQVLPRAHVRE